MFSFGVILVDVGGCDTHNDDCASPLHEAEEEEDRAKGRHASTELNSHCVLMCVIYSRGTGGECADSLANVWRWDADVIRLIL